MTRTSRIMLMRIIALISKALKVISCSPFIKFMLGYYHRHNTMSTPFLKFFINFFVFFCGQKQIYLLHPQIYCFCQPNVVQKSKKPLFLQHRTFPKASGARLNVDPVFRTRGTQMLIYGNCFKQLPSLNNILLGLNIRLWNVI